MPTITGRATSTDSSSVASFDTSLPRIAALTRIARRSIDVAREDHSSWYSCQVTAIQLSARGCSRQYQQRNHAQKALPPRYLALTVEPTPTQSLYNLCGLWHGYFRDGGDGAPALSELRAIEPPHRTSASPTTSVAARTCRSTLVNSPGLNPFALVLTRLENPKPNKHVVNRI